MPPRARACRLPCAQVRRAASAMNESPARGFEQTARHQRASCHVGEGGRGSAEDCDRRPQTRKPPARRHRETGIPCFPIPAVRESGSRSTFPILPNGNRGFLPIPGQIGNRGNGNWGCGPLAHGTCQEPLAPAADVRWRLELEISIFEDQRQHLACPPDRVWYYCSTHMG